MEIFRPAPTDLEGLTELLRLGVDEQDITKGIFGRVDYDSSNSKITIYDPYDELFNLCEVTIANNYIMFSPIFNEYGSSDYGVDGKYRDSNSGSAYNYRFRVPVNTGTYPFTAMKCKYGFIFYGTYPDWRNTQNYAGLSALIIARTSKNENQKAPITAFINAPITSSGTISGIGTQDIFITQNKLAGDAHVSPMSTSAFSFCRLAQHTYSDPAVGYGGPGYNLDKTILVPIPIPGKYGSNEFFETAFFRGMDTFEDNGVHVINGKKYGVLGNWAILDE